MTKDQLKELGDRCMCLPVSRSISEIETAGEAIRDLLQALEMIANMPLGRNHRAEAGRMREIAIRAMSGERPLTNHAIRHTC